MKYHNRPALISTKLIKECNSTTFCKVKFANELCESFVVSTDLGRTMYYGPYVKHGKF